MPWKASTEVEEPAMGCLVATAKANGRFGLTPPPVILWSPEPDWL